MVGAFTQLDLIVVFRRHRVALYGHGERRWVDVLSRITRVVGHWIAGTHATTPVRLVASITIGRTRPQRLNVQRKGTILKLIGTIDYNEIGGAGLETGTI